MYSYGSYVGVVFKAKLETSFFTAHSGCCRRRKETEKEKKSTQEILCSIEVRLSWMHFSIITLILIILTLIIIIFVLAKQTAFSISYIIIFPFLINMKC